MKKIKGLIIAFLLSAFGTGCKTVGTIRIEHNYNFVTPVENGKVVGELTFTRDG